jgi:outer membrane receptor protein involved in Fe transport
MRFAKYAIAFLLVLTSVWAQTDRGTISGIVTDTTGAVVSDAKVTAVQSGTNSAFSTVSTSTGDFTIPQMPVGSYSVRVERQGFKSFVASGVVITAGGSARIAATLDVGTVSESIEVTAAAVQMQTDDAKTSTSVSNKLVDELPLVVGGSMRSAFDLAMIAPQANRPQGTPASGNESDKAFAIGGGQAGGYAANLDGVSILTGRYSSVQWSSVNTPSIDAITEFAVDTNGFKAEYGRAQGGVITFTSKSGTNDLHGTAYEFLRNNALDARRFFEARKGIYKQNDFGWSAGGPVFIPKLYDGRNKTFWFASMEWFRNRVGANSERFSVPTPEMYNGDFSNWVDATGRRVPIYDPNTTRVENGVTVRTPFANNIIPADRFSPFAKSVLSQVGKVVYPNNGAAAGTSDYVRNNFINASGTRLDPWNKWSIKGDHSFGTNDKVTFLYNRGLHEVVPGPDGFPGLPFPLTNSPNRLTRQDSNVYRFTYTKVITPTVVNHFYGGLNYYKDSNRSVAFEGGWSQKGICLKNAWNCDVNFPIVEFSDYSRWGGDAYDGSDNNIRTFGDDLTVVRGSHTFKMGYLYDWTLYGGFGQQKISGLITTDRRSTSVPGDNTLASGGGNAFASFLLGQGYAGGTENERYVGQIFRYHSWYFQDDWRVTPKLTLNLGLRYEFQLPPLEKDDKWSEFDPTRPNPRADNFLGALKFAGSGEGRENSRTLTKGWFGGWGPRLGLAYQLNNKTTLRAAAARTLGFVKATTGSTHFDGAILNVTFNNTTNGVSPVFLVDQGLPAYQRPPVADPSFANGQSPAYWDNESVRLPENLQYTFSVQRQLANSLVLETAYNATIGTHLVAGLKNINQVPFSAIQKYGPALLTANITSAQAVAAGINKPYPSFTGSVAQALRPYPQYQDINTWSGHGDKSGHSTYHSWLVKLDKRYASGLTLNGSYVLSKLLTDADSYDADNRAADQYNRRLEKSIGQYDQTHAFKVNYVYELPFGKGKALLSNGVLSHIAGGWRVGGTHVYASGYPLSLTNGINYNIFNGRSPAQVTTYEGWVAANDNPNWAGGDRYFAPRDSYAPASIQSATVLGNATRFNPKAREPWVREDNFSVSRSFQFTEKIRMDLRGEAFNAFNRPRFNPGSTALNDPNFGIVNSTLNEPRRMQLGLKLYF